jgi:hypothetical protein
MNFIIEILISITLLSDNTPVLYKILHNGQMYTCSSYRYNDVGCIQFINVNEFNTQEISFCNNFIVIPQ